MNILAEIKGLKYTPLMCRKLQVFKFDELEKLLSAKTTFIMNMARGNQVAVSRWVSPKRTRTYPYSRVYDSLSFSGKKVTITPIFKDEGSQGDRDFLQWDTISLMSLLGVYAVITYYADASKSTRYTHKITNQRFAVQHVRSQIEALMSYQSDALHWNLSQLDNVGEIGEKALKAYGDISKKLGINMHSLESSKRRIQQLRKGKEAFMTLSRDLARKAQNRESVTRQPKEHLVGAKGTITIKNYLGGEYYFTCDEFEIHGEELYLIEGKHTEAGRLPSLGDIKDGLLKMALFTNLEDTRIDEGHYNPVPILKLTTGSGFSSKSLTLSQTKLLNLLREEARTNRFKMLVNDEFFV